MSVFKRNGKGNYYIQFTYNGKTYVKSSRTTNKKAAERMESDWKTQIHAQQELGELERITLSDALDSYYEITNKDNTRNYIKYNILILRKMFPIDLYMDQLKDHHLARFKTLRESENIGASTIRHNFNVIRGAMKWAKEHGYQTVDLEYPKIKLPRHRLRYLSRDEEQRLLEALDPKREIKNRPTYDKRPASEKRKMHDNYDLVVLLLDTGARYGEIANIEWDRIDLENKVINLWRSKVSNESIIYMTDRVYEILQRRHSEKTTKFVFTNEKGEARGYTAHGIRRAYKRAGIEDATIHDLRHTCASRLVQNGLNLYEVANVLGHVDVQTTQRYAHLENRKISERAMKILNG